MVALAGTVLVALIGPHTTVVMVGLACLVVGGAGMGFVGAPILIAAQSSVGWSERGAVTATYIFSRSIGSSVGIAIIGAVANASLGGGSGPHTPAALATAAHRVFLGVLIAAVLMLAGLAFIPRVPTTSELGDAGNGTSPSTKPTARKRESAATGSSVAWADAARDTPS